MLAWLLDLHHRLAVALASAALGLRDRVAAVAARVPWLPGRAEAKRRIDEGMRIMREGEPVILPFPSGSVTPPRLYEPPAYVRGHFHCEPAVLSVYAPPAATEETDSEPEWETADERTVKWNEEQTAHLMRRLAGARLTEDDYCPLG